jgi:hypothetical protein
MKEILLQEEFLIYTLDLLQKHICLDQFLLLSKDIIKKVSTLVILLEISTNTTREVTYSVEPRAIKNYTGNILTNLSKDITTLQIL